MWRNQRGQVALQTSTRPLLNNLANGLTPKAKVHLLHSLSGATHRRAPSGDKHGSCGSRHRNHDRYDNHAPQLRVSESLPWCLLWKVRLGIDKWGVHEAMRAYAVPLRHDADVASPRQRKSVGSNWSYPERRDLTQRICHIRALTSVTMNDAWSQSLVLLF